MENNFFGGDVKDMHTFYDIESGCVTSNEEIKIFSKLVYEGDFVGALEAAKSSGLSSVIIKNIVYPLIIEKTSLNELEAVEKLNRLIDNIEGKLEETIKTNPPKRRAEPVLEEKLV